MCDSVNALTLVNERLSVVPVFKFWEIIFGINKFSFTVMSVAFISMNKVDFIKQAFQVGC